MIGEQTTWLIERLASRLERRCWSIAVAESFTGGQLSATLVSHPSTSTRFERGFVVYSNDSKCELLGIDRAEVESCDGVSETVARYMARAAWEASRADLSAAITGFAGPRQSSEEVGLVHIAVSNKTTTRHAVHHLGDIGREAINRRAVDLALAMLISATTDRQQARAAPADPSMVESSEPGWRVGGSPVQAGPSRDYAAYLHPRQSTVGGTEISDRKAPDFHVSERLAPQGHDTGGTG